MTLTLPTNKRAVTRIAPLTASGQPAAFSSPNFVSDNEAVVTVARTSDPNEVTLVPVAPGTANVDVSVISEGSVVADAIQVTVVSMKAVTLGITIQLI